MKKKIIIKAFYVFLLSISILSCAKYNGQETIDGILNQVEYLMEDQPDSALLLLNEIDADNLKNSRIKARYSLLKSMALDKNYIDTTTFDVLQPAIDYYLKKGKPDDKVRTYYYQGVIYKNADNPDRAMEACLNALDVRGSVSDSLMLARLLVLQSTLFYQQYRILEFVNNNLTAGDIFGSKGKTQQQFRCYLKALNGAIILDDKFRSDSILNICNALVYDIPSLKKQAFRSYLNYAINYGSSEEIKSIIDEVKEVGIDDDVKMSIAQAYSKIGEYELGVECLNEATVASDDILDSLSYWSIKTLILENIGDAKGALDAFRNYTRLMDIYHDRLFSNELLFSEKKHEMEVENLGRLHDRDNIIKWILGGLLILLLTSAFLYYRYRMNKAARLIAEQNGEKLRLEAEKLQLEADNLHLELERLEDERDRLSSLLERKDGLSDEMISVIRERLDMLNGLLAKEITKEESYAKPFRKYIELLQKDHKKFQDSTRKFFQAAYPNFMAYLIEHGLTEKELNYVCLYALGLRGKEVGNYLDTPGHYNISRDIRHKLGIDSHSANLGPYIRKLMRIGPPAP